MGQKGRRIIHAGNPSFGDEIQALREKERELQAEVERLKCENTSLREEARIREARIEELKRELSELQELSARDGLTGLYNRREIERRIEANISLAKRDARPCCLLMIDVDRFKQINDRHGHQRGDLVLRHVSALLQEHIRKEDVVGRYGGEEFICSAFGTLTNVRELANRLRRAVENESLSWFSDPPSRITICVGIAEYNPPKISVAPKDGDDAFAKKLASIRETLVSQADKQLYAAKNAGRNRVFPLLC